MSGRRHRLLVVDLGGVAAHYLPDRRLGALAEATGLDPATIDAELFESGLDHRAELGAFTPDQLVDHILDRLRHTVGADELVAAWSRCFEPAAPVLEILDRQPVPRALFTNNGPLVDLCLAGPLSGLARHFDTSVCSWQIGAVKPTGAAFERAADRFGHRPADLLLLDDSIDNVTGAREAGWSAEHITPDTDLDRVLTAHG